MVNKNQTSKLLELESCGETLKRRTLLQSIDKIDWFGVDEKNIFFQRLEGINIKVISNINYNYYLPTIGWTILFVTENNLRTNHYKMVFYRERYKVRKNIDRNVFRTK